ncbi:MAG: hypothetical protein ACK4J0_02595 [Candidatus Anstonellaceae archaeon]
MKMEKIKNENKQSNSPKNLFFKYGVLTSVAAAIMAFTPLKAQDTLYVPLSYQITKQKAITGGDTVEIYSSNNKIGEKIFVDSIAINKYGQKISKEISKGDSVKITKTDLNKVDNRTDTITTILTLKNLGLSDGGKETVVRADSVELNIDSLKIPATMVSTNGKFFRIGKDQKFDSLNVDTIYVINNAIYYKERKQIDSTTTKDTLIKVKAIRIIDKDKNGKYITYNAYVEGKYFVIEANIPDSTLKEKYIFYKGRALGVVVSDKPLEEDSTGNIKGLIKHPSTKRGTVIGDKEYKIPQYVQRFVTELFVKRDTTKGKEDQPPLGINEKRNQTYLYPNPANNYLAIPEPLDQVLKEIILVNMENGQQIKKEVNNGKVDLEGVPVGGYIAVDPITGKVVDKVMIVK